MGLLVVTQYLLSVMFPGTGRGLEHFLSVLSADIWGGVLRGRMGEPERWLEGRARKIVTRYNLGQVVNSRTVTCLWGSGEAWAESCQGSRTFLWMLQENKHQWQTQCLNQHRWWLKRETSSKYKSGLEAVHMNPPERSEIRLLTLAVLLQSICSVHTLSCGVASPCTAAKHRQNCSFIPLS